MVSSDPPPVFVLTFQSYLYYYSVKDAVKNIQYRSCKSSTYTWRNNAVKYKLIQLWNVKPSSTPSLNIKFVVVFPWSRRHIRYSFHGSRCVCVHFGLWSANNGITPKTGQNEYWFSIGAWLYYSIPIRSFVPKQDSTSILHPFPGPECHNKQ